MNLKLYGTWSSPAFVGARPYLTDGDLILREFKTMGLNEDTAMEATKEEPAKSDFDVFFEEAVRAGHLVRPERHVASLAFMAGEVARAKRYVESLEQEEPKPACDEFTGKPVR
jgi:hypothetical protein